MRRISDDHDYTGNGEDDQRFIGDPSGLGFDLGTPAPSTPDFGTGDVFAPPASGGGDLASLFGAQQGSHSEGNTERGRDLRPQDTPTAQPMDMGLPAGVSVNDALAAQDSDPSSGGGGWWNGGTQLFPPAAHDPGNPPTLDTPAMSATPNPVAAQTPNPGYAQVGSQTPTAPTVGTGPRRRSVVAPQIFGESKSPLLFGRAGGLLGGGLGATGGGEASGPIAPTQQMLKLLQLFQQQP